MPCNVNVSSAYSDHIQPFLNEDNKRRTKNESFSSNHEGSYNRVEESQLFGAKSGHTIIDIYDQDETKHLLACESLAQVKFFSLFVLFEIFFIVFILGKRTAARR